MFLFCRHYSCLNIALNEVSFRQFYCKVFLNVKVKLHYKTCRSKKHNSGVDIYWTFTGQPFIE